MSHTARKLLSVGREYGPRYATLSIARKAIGSLPERIDEQLLSIEGRKGVLGPAHRRWTQHSVARNREIWSAWEWGAGGEEWTASAAWKESLVADVLEPTMPQGGTILEIGPGAGRWTAALHARADRLILVDITDTTLELCRERLGDPDDVVYLCTAGSSLEGIDDAGVDAIWTFDAFVHIAPLDVAAYLEEVRRVLRPGGVALIHHTGRRDPRGWRSPMGALLFANLARERGLSVERQFDRWGDDGHGLDGHGDVISIVRRPV